MKVGQDIYLAHVPERIAPGKAVEELLNAPRVVECSGVLSETLQKA